MSIADTIVDKLEKEGIIAWEDVKERAKEIIQDMINQKAWNIIKELSEYILVANWYDKQDLEEVLGRKLTDKEFENIIAEWNRRAEFDMINDIIRNFVKEVENEKF